MGDRMPTSSTGRGHATPEKRTPDAAARSRWTRLIVPVLALGVTPSVVAQQVPAPRDADSLPPGVTRAMIERGNALFHGRGMCVNCHGDDATGLLGPDLTDGDWIRAKGSYLSILQVVLSGVPADVSASGVEMPPRGGAPLDDVEAQAVAGWVWAIAHPASGDSLPHGLTRELVERGERVFHAPDGCTRCHGAEATGDIGPNLTDDDWLHAKGSYLAILNQILVGVPEDQSSRGIPMPPRGGSSLSDSDVHDVAAYVWYISHRR